MMSENWDILIKELAYFGFEIKDFDCRVKQSKGEYWSGPTVKAAEIVRSELKENISLFRDLWSNVNKVLTANNSDSPVIDEMEMNVFIFSLQDMLSLLKVFEELDGSTLSKQIEAAVNRDSLSFTQEQIASIPEYKMSIDWVFRLINKDKYVLRLLEAVERGEKQFDDKVKIAQHTSGPWNNLDLPMKERVWDWREESENIESRQWDIRKQRRYTKGLENYNNGGAVGEGHYWRELRNEPYSWYDRDEESPYPGRWSLLH